MKKQELQLSGSLNGRPIQIGEAIDYGGLYELSVATL